MGDPFSADSSSDRENKVPTSPAAKVKMKECPLCALKLPLSSFPRLSCCSHRSCHTCLVQYLQLEILESRILLSCPECSEMLHPNDIYFILADMPHLLEKYEEFSLRRLLMADPDTRWCPAPDCSYAVIASGCAACPEIRCQRPGCGTQFCYHCKMLWHPNQTCDEARFERDPFASLSPVHFDTTIRPGDVKACPRCRTFIVKMNDGSCNHMVCAICGVEFCWLCLKEISDLHYLSPSGCTFWGKKPWSKKKKLLWQLVTLIGAPVGIALIAGIAVPAIIFGVPVFVGRKVYQRMKDKPSKARRRLAIVGSVAGSLLISPVLATMAVGVGVPLMLLYVYGVVPLSLCRNGNCGVSASSSGVRLDVDEDLLAMTGGENQEKTQLLKDTDRNQDGATLAGVSIHSGSSVGFQQKLQVQADVCGPPGRRRPSVESGGMSLGDRYYNYEDEASTRAMAGSTYCDDKSMRTMGSLQEGGSYSEDQASTKALSGSVMETKSICGGVSSGGDNASLRALAGSIGPDSVSARHLVQVETHHHHHQPKSDRGSPAPLLEEDLSDNEIPPALSVSTTAAQGSNSSGDQKTGVHRGRFLSATSCPHRSSCGVSTSSEVIELNLEDGSVLEATSTGGNQKGIILKLRDAYERSAVRSRRLRICRVKLFMSGISRLSLPPSYGKLSVYRNSQEGTEVGASVSRTHSHEPHRNEGEFMLLSADTFHQLHVDFSDSRPKKARSVNLLLESSPGELWHLISDEPWAVFERMRSGGSVSGNSHRNGGAPGAGTSSGRRRQVSASGTTSLTKLTKSTGSYNSLPDSSTDGSNSGKSGWSGIHFPKFSGFIKRNSKV